MGRQDEEIGSFETRIRAPQSPVVAGSGVWVNPAGGSVAGVESGTSGNRDAGAGAAFRPSRI